MRIAVASCWKYADAWPAFDGLFKKFWPDQTYTLIADTEGNPRQWCKVVADYAANTLEPILLFQEDFLLNAPVNNVLVEMGRLIGLRESVGAVRLYPCPGSNVETDDPYFGKVEPHTPYRTSCQATIWNPEYLHAIASRFNTPAEFELLGSSWASANRPEEVWAFRRELKDWPLQYYCSAISRGLWESAALEFCRANGIEVDTSMRGIAS